ncbi:hypothetical protein KIH74_12960 [Kineosporia sp. J2-2]|uniref:Uncharacterized protein n=1 Tax=Kineosporia corallincola TaxID=2835133 RepID=A0ABS5TFL6_9ACTN|nr:hypothetical protein [Kineosporia corallincola]MBT0769840.1 hypothetical protein [Kineosporia corallincola]
MFVQLTIRLRFRRRSLIPVAVGALLALAHARRVEVPEEVVACLVTTIGMLMEQLAGGNARDEPVVTAASHRGATITPGPQALVIPGWAGQLVPVAGAGGPSQPADPGAGAGV